MSPPTGATRVAGIIGDPVRHSLSPRIHNAAFAAAGLDWVYVAFPVTRGHGRQAVAAMRVLEIHGLSVTMPHKEDAAAACEAVSDRAARLRAVNAVVRRDDGTLFGDSTDGEGLIRAMREEEIEIAGARAVVLGAGGAGRAVALALADAGASVVLAARRVERAHEGAVVAGVVPLDASLGSPELDGAVADAELIVNATPLGMRGESPPFSLDALGPRQTVVDLVYAPPSTPLLEAAASRGARTMEGSGMLLHQAALAFTLWTGVDAPVDAMRAAMGDVLPNH